MSRFQDAVDYVAEQIGPHVQNGQLAHSGHPIERSALELHLGIWLDPTAANGRPDFIVPKGADAVLLDCCQTTPGAYELLADIAAFRIQSGRPLSSAMRIFAALHLMGRLKKPSQTKRSKTWNRNQTLLHLAYMCRDHFDLQLSRGDASKVQESACDAVSVGVTRAGHAISPRAIKELVVGSKPENKQLRDEYREMAELAVEVGRERPDLVELWHDCAVRPNWDPRRSPPFRRLTEK